MKNGTEHDMTQGAVAVPLIGFTIPLVLGNFFQLFYNAADSIIVGRYVGERALAAVGTSTPVMNLVILLISGLCMGASILMSSQFGAGNYEQLSRQISTTLLSGCGFSIGFSVLTILVSEPLLRLIQVPKEVMPMRLRISGSFLSEFCLRLFTIFLPIHFGHWAIVKRRCIFWLPVQF